MRLRRFPVKLWYDPRFTGLPSPEPGAKALYFYLALGPHQPPLPGLVVKGPRRLAEELRRSWEDLRLAWAQLKDSGLMIADEEARVVYLPDQLAVDPPRNPNMLKGWLRHYKKVPDCFPKLLFYRALARHIKARVERNPGALWGQVFALFEEPEIALKIVTA